MKSLYWGLYPREVKIEQIKPIKKSKGKTLKTVVNNSARAALGVSVKNRNDYADYDYIDKLDSTTLDWLKGFHREYVNADFKHKHNKPGLTTKECYDMNNARNRDLFSWSKARHILDYADDINESDLVYHKKGMFSL